MINRKDEEEIFIKECEKGEASLIAVYGRRRIGKTFFIRDFIKQRAGSCISFQFTGSKDVSSKDHLTIFIHELKSWLSYTPKNRPTSWMEAFIELSSALDLSQSQNPDKKLAIFIDELPWVGSKDFMAAFSWFYNSYFESCANGICIVCGSATTWMIEKFVKDKKGFHDRITAEVRMHAFNLEETERYLQWKGFELDRKSICDVYMVTGGVAKYLSYFEKQYSIIENIQNIYFSTSGRMSDEYNEIMTSLFGIDSLHEKIIKVLSEGGAGHGLEASELSKKINLNSTGGAFSKALSELVISGFIMPISKMGSRKKNMTYRLSDPFCHFYNKWMSKLSKNDLMRLPNDYWEKEFSSQSWVTWAGHAFENICHIHYREYLKARGISGTSAQVYYWKYIASTNSNELGAEIDMVVERESTYELVECKYYNDEFTISSAYANNLKNKIEMFKKYGVRSKKHDIKLVMLTSYGTKKNAMYNTLNVSQSISIDDLFVPV